MKRTSRVSIVPPAIAVACLALGTSVACAPVGSEAEDVQLESSQQDVVGSNGLPSNGLPSNGLPSNGLPSNGLPSNGLGGNGLPSNGLPSNGLPSNGLPSNGLFNNWFHWFQGCTTADGCLADPTAGSTGSGTAASRAMASTLMKYVVECACPPATTINYTDRTGAAYAWKGVLGLAPGWCPASGTPAAATVAEQEWVSACLLGVVNRYGTTNGSVQISMTTANPERSATLAPAAAEDELFSDGFKNHTGKTRTTAYYGNLFGDPSSGQKGRYVAPYDLNTMFALHIDDEERNAGRDCYIDGCGAMVPTGVVRVQKSHEDGSWPDSHGHNPPQTVKCTTSAYGADASACTDDTSRTWNRVIMVHLSRNQIYTDASDNHTPEHCLGVASSDEAMCVHVKGSGYWIRTPSHTSDDPLVLRYAGNYALQQRIHTTQAANIRGTITVNGATVFDQVIAVPNTNGVWNRLVVPFTNPTTYAKDATVLVTWSYADATTPTIDLDQVYISIQ